MVYAFIHFVFCKNKLIYRIDLHFLVLIKQLQTYYVRKV
jgi:hypothetical protein